ncbi:Sjogren's syndrome/scleroderma autoantigen 1 family protein [[Eubacterium] cellulosolvens]
MSAPVKKMAELLKSGGILLSEQCPVCNSPLFDIQGKIYCVKCEKQVQIIKSTEEENRLKETMILTDLETTLYTKMKDALNHFKAGTEISHLSDSVSLLSKYLDLLEKVKRLRQGM